MVVQFCSRVIGFSTGIVPAALRSCIGPVRSMARFCPDRVRQSERTWSDSRKREDPGMVAEFDLPAGNETTEVFRAFAHRMLDHGQARKELLVKHGLTDTLLDDFTAALAEFDEAVDASSEGRREQVGARAELRAVSDELIVLVDLLDGLNRYRFSGNAELQAAWASARKVVAGPRVAEVPDEVPQAAVPQAAVPPAGPSQAASGDVRPAA
jgi:hypothetical protein